MSRQRIRILVADNDPEVFPVFEIQLAQYGLQDHIELIRAHEPAEALKAIDDNYLDMAFVDLMFSPDDRDDSGLAVLTRLGERSPRCIPVLMTAYVSRNFAEVSRRTTTMTGGRTYLYNKSDHTGAQIPTLIKNFFQERIDAEWSMSLPDAAVDSMISKGKRIQAMRKNRDAVRDEMECLLFDLFNEPASIALSSQKVTIELEMMSPGMSASITLRARPHYGVDKQSQPIYGNRCVVKIGARNGIDEEVSRFNRLVKLGVPSEFRVELIASAIGDTLGAVCYSFAGGSQSDEIVSLDEFLLRQDLGAAASVINQVFNKKSKNWWAVEGEPMSVQGFYSKNFGTKFPERVKSIHDFLKRGKEWNYDEKHSRVSFEGFSFDIPSESDLGKSSYFASHAWPACLVHGDMHGGNVLVDSYGRTSLIDYATAGFGPRFADAVAMAATVRLRSGPSASPAVDAAKFFNHELALVHNRPVEDQVRAAPWFQLSKQIETLVLSNFGNSEDLLLRKEYAVTQCIYGISIFGLASWSAWQKMRIVSWIAALHKFIVEP